MSIWIPATISVASQDLRWPEQQEKSLQSLSGEMQEAELGTSFLPTARHPPHPSWQLGAGPLVGGWQGVGWLPDPCAMRPGVWEWRQPRVFVFFFGLRAD